MIAGIRWGGHIAGPFEREIKIGEGAADKLKQGLPPTVPVITGLVLMQLS